MRQVVGGVHTLRYLQADHLGSATLVSDMGGSLLAQERYSAFGVQQPHALPATTDQLYTGQRLNTIVGLYHYSDGTSAGRFYDPLLGRFVQPDPFTPKS